jgi:putative transposase
VWRKWLAACRYCYNQAIALVRSGRRLSKLKLRNEVMQSDLPEWVKETLCHIRQNAVFDAHLAFRKSPNAKFRSCRDSSQSIKFNDANFSSGSWYSRLTKGLTFIASEPIPKTCDQGTQLVFAKGRWFAVFPEPVAITPTESTGVIALDPGVRTFMTGFDRSRFLEFGSGDIGRITRLCQHLDNLMSRIAQEPSRSRRRRMRQADHRMRTKIRNLVDEAHKQIAHYLTIAVLNQLWKTLTPNPSPRTGEGSKKCYKSFRIAITLFCHSRQRKIRNPRQPKEGRERNRPDL